jgi:hypothetical protein
MTRLAPTPRGARLALAALAPLAGCASGDADDPARLFHDLARAFEEGRPLALLEMVPERYHREANALVHAFAERMDAEVWAGGFRVAGKLGRVLDEKRALLLGHPLASLAIAADPGAAGAELDAAVAALEAIAASDAATLPGLARIDLCAFLVDTVGERLLAPLEPEVVRAVARPLLASLDLGWVAEDFTTTVQRLPERTTVTIHRAGRKDQRYDVVRIDGRWMLEASAALWDRALAEARARVEAFALTPERKAEILSVVRDIEGALDRMLAARDAAEFEAALGDAFGTLAAPGVR